MFYSSLGVLTTLCTCRSLPVYLTKSVTNIPTSTLCQTKYKSTDPFDSTSCTMSTRTIAFICILLSQLLAAEGNFMKNMMQAGKGSGASVINLKAEILTLARKVDRGYSETPAEKETMLILFEQLEKKNKFKDSLKSSLINAVWNLEYTTSGSILGRGGSQRVGPILQTIDGPNLYAKNSETVNYFGFLKVPRSVTAALTPMTGSKVAVQFKKLTLGPIGFNAPDSFKGELDITYIDEDLRLSRGDKGNIFVLTRYADLPLPNKSVSL